MDYTLTQLNEAALEIGKGVLFYSNKWNPESDLVLTHLGDTEGPVRFEANEQIGGLQLPEIYGPGNIKAWSVGAAPTLVAPLFLATPELRTLITPTGNGIIGSLGRRPVKEFTLVTFPQALYYNAATGRFDAKVQYTAATGWLKSAEDVGDPDDFVALSADEERLLGLSIWMWNGFWARPPITYEATVTDVVKNIEEATFSGMPHFGVKGGVMVTIGAPDDYDIEIDYTAP